MIARLRDGTAMILKAGSVGGTATGVVQAARSRHGGGVGALDGISLADLQQFCIGRTRRSVASLA